MWKLCSLLCLGICVSVAPVEAKEAFAHIKSAQINESSGIVASQRYPGVFWTHNDSGDTARIFAIHRDGSPVNPGHPDGIEITGAKNVDWEDICLSSDGHLIVGDIGNNENKRRDLCLYLFPEPDPTKDTVSQPAVKLRVAYSDQFEFPPRERNFDAEALFTIDNQICILTKDRGDHRTRLYALDISTADFSQINTLQPLADYDIEGLVTAADYSPKHQLLAVLTYDDLWLFRPEEIGKDFWKNKLARQRLSGLRQCEAICFDGDNLLVTNEQAELFVFSLNDLTVEPASPPQPSRFRHKK